MRYFPNGTCTISGRWRWRRRRWTYGDAESSTQKFLRYFAYGVVRHCTATHDNAMCWTMRIAVTDMNIHPYGHAEKLVECIRRRSLIKIAQKRIGVDWSRGRMGGRPERFVQLYFHRNQVWVAENLVFVRSCLTCLFFHELCNTVLRHVDRIFAYYLHVRWRTASYGNRTMPYDAVRCRTARHQRQRT